MAIIAPWLKAPDIAGEYLRGLAIGQQASQAQQRLQAEMERTAMEAEVRANTLKQQALQDAQRIQVTKAYHDAEIGLKQQQLQEVAQVNAQKTRQAAVKLHQQTTFNRVYGETKDVQKALFASGMGTPQNVMAARKDVEDLGSQRLAQRQEALEFREQQAKDKAAKVPVPRRIGERMVTDPVTGDKTTTYQFDQTGVPPKTGTAGAKGGKRLRFNPDNGKLEPVGAPAESDVNQADEE